MHSASLLSTFAAGLSFVNEYLTPVTGPFHTAFWLPSQRIVLYPISPNTSGREPRGLTVPPQPILVYYLLRYAEALILFDVARFPPVE